MSIQFNMTNAQELGMKPFMWGICNHEDSRDDCRRIDKQLPTSQLSLPLDVHIPIALKTTKRKRNTNSDDENRVEELPDHKTHIWTERQRRKKMRDMFSKLHALLPQLPLKADKSKIVDAAVSSIQSLEKTLRKLQMQRLEKLQRSSASNPTFAHNPSSSSSPTTLLTLTSNHAPQMLPIGSAPTSSLVEKIPPSSAAAAVNLPYPCKDPIAAFETWSSGNIVLNICGNEAQFNMCFPKDKSGAFTSVCYFLEKYNIEVLTANVSINVSPRNYMIQAQVNPSSENQLLGSGYGVGDIFKRAAQEMVVYFSSP